MKKLFIAALIVVAAGTSAFALDVKKVDNKVKSSFEAQFAGAEDVAWNVTENYIKATFVLNEEAFEAFFGKDAELIGTSRKVDFKILPAIAKKSIKKEYASYKIIDTIEFDREGEKTYFVSLEDGNKKQILEVSLYGNVHIFKGGVK
ncbi:MAG: hypothetical protein ABIS69_04675 [Sediminibacterium sp.]